MEVVTGDTECVQQEQQRGEKSNNRLDGWKEWGCSMSLW